MKNSLELRARALVQTAYIDPVPARSFPWEGLCFYKMCLPVTAVFGGLDELIHVKLLQE